MSTHQNPSSANSLPSWIEMYDGWEHTDSLGRVVRARFSRFHGLMLTVDGKTAYVGEEAAGLRTYIGDRMVSDEIDRLEAELDQEEARDDATDF